MVPFLGLYTRYTEVADTKAKADMELLVATAEALNTLQDHNFPQTYYNRLYLGMLWCINVAKTVGNAINKPSPTTRPSTIIPSAPDVQPVPSSTEPDQPRKPSGPTVSTSKPAVRTLPQEDSPRPRKRFSLRRKSPAGDGYARVMSWAQNSSEDTDVVTHPQQVNHSAENFPQSRDRIQQPTSFLDRGSANSTPTIPVPSCDRPGSQNWNFPMSNPDNCGPVFSNMQHTTATLPAEVFYEVGTFDNFMPRSASMMEPWDIEMADENTMDIFELPKV